MNRQTDRHNFFFMRGKQKLLTYLYSNKKKWETPISFPEAIILYSLPSRNAPRKEKSPKCVTFTKNIHERKICKHLN